MLITFSVLNQNVIRFLILIFNKKLAKVKYYYDTNTCRYERVVTRWQDVLLNFTGFSVLSVVFSGCMFFAYVNFFDSAKERKLRIENDELRTNYHLLHDKFDQILVSLRSLKEKDNAIYRVIFETKQRDFASSANLGQEKYKSFASFAKMDKNELVNITYDMVDELNLKLKTQTKSFDELLNIALKKQDMLASIPAIQPVSNKELRHFASGYGMRMHPIYKVMRFHAGCDFSAVRGTPIYATGNGIAQVKKDFEGYGNCIEIEHGFGFMTRYGHCDKIKIKQGQKVKRGEIIGFVGSTGTATSPHLHYEVHKNGSTVDPIHYFFNDLSSSEYEELIKIAGAENQSLG